MRRGVQDAIRSVRQTIASDKRYRMQSGTAWLVAETLADEVERLHKRLEPGHACGFCPHDTSQHTLTLNCEACESVCLERPAE